MSNNLLYIVTIWKDLLSYNELPENCKPEGFEGDVNEKRYFFLPQVQDSHNLNDILADYVDAEKDHPVAKKFHIFNKMRTNLFGDIVFLAIDKSGSKYKVLYVNSYLNKG